MKTYLLLLVVAFGFVASGSSLRSAEPPPGIAWQTWTDDLFTRARAEKKLVLLDLVAVWCHWCHVMDEITYRDPEVVRLLQQGYIAVRLDQDARPDLSNRYEDYGWPATIVFDSEGKELAKRQGYLPPKPMAGMLQAFLDDPTPGPSVQPEPSIEPAVGTAAALGGEQRKVMRAAFDDAYDAQRGGWGEVHKFLNWNALEYCLTEGAQGDLEMSSRARQTLESGLKLIDPVWGGVYQYSTDGDWDHPHFEKIMPFQAENLRVFAIAATLLHEPRWLEPARQIRRYLREFLSSPDGVFYVSQDADLVAGEHSAEYFALDDVGRRAQGIPKVDRHVYARENGLAITGLVALAMAGGDPDALDEARRAAAWIIEHRAIEGGGFRHDDHDAAGPYLGDTLAMARAFFALYTATAERAWLTKAVAAAEFIDQRFRLPVGVATSAVTPGAPFSPKPQVDENIALVRLAVRLHHATGDTRWRLLAEHAMRYLAVPAIVEQQGFGTSGILLAERELLADPMHLTIVGAKDDAVAAALFAAALRGAPPFARIEWFDRREGPLPHDDVPFPELPQAAAFVCAQGGCSSPILTADRLADRLAKRAVPALGR